MLANVVLPVLALHGLVMLFLLAPVTVLEALVLRAVCKVRWPAAFQGSWLANGITTAVGIPVAYAASVAVGLASKGVIADEPSVRKAVLQAALQASYPGDPNQWMDGVGMAALMVPCFLASVWLERRVLIRHLDTTPPAVCTRAAWLANVLSYLGLTVLCTL